MVNIVIVGGGTSRSDGGTKHFWQIFSDVIMVIQTDNVCQGNQHNVLQSPHFQGYSPFTEAQSKKFPVHVGKGWWGFEEKKLIHFLINFVPDFPLFRTSWSKMKQMKRRVTLSKLSGCIVLEIFRRQSILVNPWPTRWKQPYSAQMYYLCH